MLRGARVGMKRLATMSVLKRIFNLNKSFLLKAISSERDSRDPLWQSGNLVVEDLVVEVINRGNGRSS